MAKRIGEEEKEKEKEEKQTALIKSSNPHLAGREKKKTPNPKKVINDELSLFLHLFWGYHEIPEGRGSIEVCVM